MCIKIIARNDSFEGSVEYQVISLFRYLKTEKFLNSCFISKSWLRKKVVFQIVQEIKF